MKKRSSLYKPNQILVDQVYEWASHNYFVRLLPRLKSYEGYSLKLIEIRKHVEKELDKINKAIEKSESIVYIREYNNSLNYNMREMCPEDARDYYSDMLQVIAERLSNSGFENIYDEDEGEDHAHPENYKLLINRLQLEVHFEPELKTINETKKTAETIVEHDDRKCKVKFLIIGDDQSSRFYPQEGAEEVYIVMPNKSLWVRNENEMNYYLRFLHEDIDHELTHLKQFSNMGKGLPSPKVREKDSDISGFVYKKKPHKKIRTNERITHSLREIEFWPNLRSTMLYFRHRLEKHNSKGARRELLDHLIDFNPIIEGLKSNPEKKKLFLKHLISSLSDLL